MAVEHARLHDARWKFRVGRPQLVTGEAVGLHYAGRYQEDNIAVPAAVLNRVHPAKAWNTPVIVETGRSETVAPSAIGSRTKSVIPRGTRYPAPRPSAAGGDGQRHYAAHDKRK